MSWDSKVEPFKEWIAYQIQDIEDSFSMGHISEENRNELVGSYNRILHELAWLNAEIPDEQHLTSLPHPAS